VAILASIGIGYSGLISSRIFGVDYGSARGRLPQYKTAVEVIKAHPLSGVGVKNYWKVFHLYNPNIAGGGRRVVHNAYLLKAAEMGIPGLLVFLWLLGSILLHGLRNIKIQNNFLVLINIGILTGMISLWAHWLVEPAWLSVWSNFWILSGIIVATERISQRNLSFDRVNTINEMR